MKKNEWKEVEVRIGKGRKPRKRERKKAAKSFKRRTRLKKNNEETNEGAETATSEMPVPSNPMPSVKRILKDLHAKHSSNNKQQQTQRTDPNTKGSGEASGSLHGAS